MSDAPARAYLRRQLEAHITELGYSCKCDRAGEDEPEVARMNPLRRRLAYGETVLHSDLRSKRCHERLILISQRRTRRRSSILFFIAVAARDKPALDALLTRLEVQNGIRGGHVHVVPIAPPAAPATRAPATRAPAPRARATRARATQRA
jgi:hypothetical protein